MDELFQKYKQRIEALNISQKDKERIYSNIYNEIQYKLVNSFFKSLTPKQKKSIAETESDEEALEIYFRLILDSLQRTEVIHSLEEIYTQSMMQALSEIPEI